MAVAGAAESFRPVPGGPGRSRSHGSSPLRESSCVPNPRSIDVPAIRFALASGLSQTEAARKFGFTASSIRRALRRAGVPARTPPPPVDPHLRRLWARLVARCHDSRDKAYRLYGAKGIRVAPEWADAETFFAWAKATGWTRGSYLDLKVRSQGYRSSNCRWVTRPTVIARGQAAARGADVLIRAFGEAKTARAWALDPRCKVSGKAVVARLARGMTASAAITTPSQTVKRGVRTCPDRPSSVNWRRVRKLHVVEGQSVAQVARAVGASHHTVLRGLQARGWWRRP